MGTAISKFMLGREKRKRYQRRLNKQLEKYKVHARVFVLAERNPAVELNNAEFGWHGACDQQRTIDGLGMSMEDAKLLYLFFTDVDEDGSGEVSLARTQEPGCKDCSTWEFTTGVCVSLSGRCHGVLSLFGPETDRVRTPDVHNVRCRRIRRDCTFVCDRTALPSKLQRLMRGAGLPRVLGCALQLLYS